MSLHRRSTPRSALTEGTSRDRSHHAANVKHTSTLFVKLASNSKVRGSFHTGVDPHTTRRATVEHKNVQTNKRLNNSRKESDLSDKEVIRLKVSGISPTWRTTSKATDKNVDSPSGVDARSSRPKLHNRNWNRQDIYLKSSKHRDPCPVWRVKQSNQNENSKVTARPAQCEKRVVLVKPTGTKQLTDVTNYCTENQNKIAKKAKLTRTDINVCTSPTVDARMARLSAGTKCSASQNEYVIKNPYPAAENYVVGHPDHNRGFNAPGGEVNKVVNILKSENIDVCGKQDAAFSEKLKIDKPTDSNWWPKPITTNTQYAASTHDMQNNHINNEATIRYSSKCDSEQSLLSQDASFLHGCVNTNKITEPADDLQDQQNSKLPKVLCNIMKHVTRGTVSTIDSSNDRKTTDGQNDVGNAVHLIENGPILDNVKEKLLECIDKAANLDKSMNRRWLNKSNSTTLLENISSDSKRTIENIRQDGDTIGQTDTQEAALELSSNSNQLSVTKTQGKDLKHNLQQPDGPDDKRCITSYIASQRLSRGTNRRVNQHYKKCRPREERSPSFLSWKTFHFPENLDVDELIDIENNDSSNLESSEDKRRCALYQKDGDIENVDKVEVDNQSIDGDGYLPVSEPKTGNVNNVDHLSFSSCVHTHENIKQILTQDGDTDINIHNQKYLADIKTYSNNFLDQKLSSKNELLDDVVKVENNLNKLSRNTHISQELCTQQGQNEQEAFFTGITHQSFSPGTGKASRISVNTDSTDLKCGDKSTENNYHTSLDTNVTNNDQNPNPDLTCGGGSDNNCSDEKCNSRTLELEKDIPFANIEQNASVQVDLTTIGRGHAHGHGHRSLTTYTKDNTGFHIDGNEACNSNKKGSYYSNHHDQAKTDLLYDGLKFKGAPCSANTEIPFSITSCDRYRTTVTCNETQTNTYDVICTREVEKKSDYITYTGDQSQEQPLLNNQKSSLSSSNKSNVFPTQTTTCDGDYEIGGGQYELMICDEQVPAVNENKTRTTDVVLELEKQQHCVTKAGIAVSPTKVETKSKSTLEGPAKCTRYRKTASDILIVKENEKNKYATTGIPNKMNNKSSIHGSKTKATSSLSSLKFSSSTPSSSIVQRREAEKSATSKQKCKLSSADRDELSNPSRRRSSAGLSSACNKTVGHRASVQNKPEIGEKVKLQSRGNRDNGTVDSSTSKRILNRTIDKSAPSTRASQKAKTTLNSNRENPSEKLLKKNGTSTIASKQFRSFNVKDANKKCTGNSSTTPTTSRKDVDDDNVKKRCKPVAKNVKNSSVISDGAEPVSHTFAGEVNDCPIQIGTSNLSERLTSDSAIGTDRYTKKNNGVTLSHDSKVNKTPGITIGVELNSSTPISNLQRTRNQLDTNFGSSAKTNSSSADRENNSKTFTKIAKTTHKLGKPKTVGSIQHVTKHVEKNEGLLRSIADNSEQKSSKSSVTLSDSSVAGDQFGHTTESGSIIREQKYQQSLPSSLHSILDPLNPISSQSAEGDAYSGEQKFGTALCVYRDAPLSACVQSRCSQLSAINFHPEAAFNLVTNAPASYQTDCIADGRDIIESEIDSCKYGYRSADSEKDSDHCVYTDHEKLQTNSQSSGQNQSTTNKLGVTILPDVQNIEHVSSKRNGNCATIEGDDYDVSLHKQCLPPLSKQNCQSTLSVESQNCASDNEEYINDSYVDNYSQVDMDFANKFTSHVEEELADDHEKCYGTAQFDTGKKCHQNIVNEKNVEYVDSKQGIFYETCDKDYTASNERVRDEIDKTTHPINREMEESSSKCDDKCDEMFYESTERKVGKIVEGHMNVVDVHIPDDRLSGEWNQNGPDITACNNEVMNNYDSVDRPGKDVCNIEDNTIGLHKHDLDTRPRALGKQETTHSPSADVVDKQNDNLTKDRRLPDTTGNERRECLEIVTVSESCAGNSESEDSNFKGETVYPDLHSQVKCDLIGKYTEEKGTPLSQKEDLETSRSSNKGFNAEKDNLLDLKNSHVLPDSSEETLFQKLISESGDCYTNELCSPVASSYAVTSTGSDSIGNMCTNKQITMDNDHSKEVKPAMTKKKQSIPQATKLQRTKIASRDLYSASSTQKHFAKKQTKDDGIKSGGKMKTQMSAARDKANKIQKESSLSRESSPAHSTNSDDTWTSCSTAGTKRLSIGSKESCDSKIFMSVKEKKETCDTRNMKAKRTDIKLPDSKSQVGKRKVSSDSTSSDNMSCKRSPNVSSKSIPTCNASNPKSQLKSADTKTKHRSSHLVKPQIKTSSISNRSASSSKVSSKSTLKGKQNKREELDTNHLVTNKKSDTDKSATKLSSHKDGSENKDHGKLPIFKSLSPVPVTIGTNRGTDSEATKYETKVKTDKLSSTMKEFVNLKQKTYSKDNTVARSLQTQNRAVSSSSLPKKPSYKPSASCRNSTGSKVNDLANHGSSLSVNVNTRKSGIPSPVPLSGSSLARKQKTNSKPGVEIKKLSITPELRTKGNKKQHSVKQKSGDTVTDRVRATRNDGRTKSGLKESPVLPRRMSKESSPGSTSRPSTPSGSDVSSVDNDSAPKSILKLVRTKAVKQTSRLVPPKSAVPKFSKQNSDLKMKEKGVSNREKGTKVVKEIHDERENLKTSNTTLAKNANLKTDCRSKQIRESASTGSLTDTILSHINSGYSREVIVSSLPVSESFENSSGVDSPFTTPPESNKQFNSAERLQAPELGNYKFSMDVTEKSAQANLTDTHLTTSKVEYLSRAEADDEMYATLNTINKSRCETSTVARSEEDSKTVNKVLKSDLVDQLPQSSLSNTTNIKELRATCRRNIKFDNGSTQVNLEQLSSNVFERSKIPSIEKHNHEPKHMQIANKERGTLHQDRCGRSSASDSGSSDDYWSINDDDSDQGDNVGDEMHGDRIIVTADVQRVHDTFTVDGTNSVYSRKNIDTEDTHGGDEHRLTLGDREHADVVKTHERSDQYAVNSVSDDAPRKYSGDSTCEEQNNTCRNGTVNDLQNECKFDNNSGEKFQKQTSHENVYVQPCALCHTRLEADDQIQKHTGRMRETTGDNVVNEMHSHSKDLPKQNDCTVDDLFSKNKTSFDLVHENITHHGESDEDMETVLINSSESSETRGNCAKDKNQYGSTDYEEKLPEQANLGEYFDDGIDKLEMQVKELDTGDRELLKSIKHSGGGSQPTEEALRGSMDNISHLSFSQNILTHQNKQDVLCSGTIRNKTQHTQLSSALLTPEYSEKPVTRVNEGENVAYKLDQESERKNVDDIINKNCEREFGEIKSAHDYSSNGIHIKTENLGFDSNGEGINLDVQNNAEVLISWSPRNIKDVTDDHFLSEKTVDSVNGLTEKIDHDCNNISTNSNSSTENNENYDELSISEEDDSEDMNGQLGFYQANMSAKTLKPEETGETSNTIVAPPRTISHSETCIKYEIVTTTITKHKKRETKIIESCSGSSNLSTTNPSGGDSAVLHERQITSPRKVRNSQSIKFESKEVKTSTSDSQGNVYSSVKNAESKQVVKSSIDGGVSDGDRRFQVGAAASILGERDNANAIESPVNNHDCFNVNNEQELQEKLREHTGSLLNVVNNGFNTNIQGNSVAISQQGNNKLKSIHGYPDLSSHVTGGQLSKVNDEKFTDRNCRNNSTQSCNLVTTKDKHDNGDSEISRTDTEQAIDTEIYEVHTGAIDECQTSSNFNQMKANTAFSIDRSVLNSTRSIDHQSVLSERRIKEIESFKGAHNTQSQTQRLSTQDSLPRRDIRLLTDNSVGISGVSSTSNTSNTGYIYENKMGIGDNTLDNHESLKTRIETPKVAILVTRNQSESDNGEESSDPDAEDDQNTANSAICASNADNSDNKLKYSKTAGKENMLNNKDVTELSQNKVLDSVSLMNTLPEPEQVTNIEEENYFTVTLPVPPNCVSVTLETSLSTSDLYKDDLNGHNAEQSTTDTEACFSLHPLDSSNDTLPDIEQTIILAENSSENILPDEGHTSAEVSLNPNTRNAPSVTQTQCRDIPDISVTNNEDSSHRNQMKDVSNQQTENKDRSKSQKREIDRQNLRRYTATVCLVDIHEDDSDSAVTMSPPSRPRARSKSPIELKNMGAVPESKQQVSVFGSGRVSDICRTFIEKARTKGKPVPDEPPSSPLTQSPSPTRKQKWLRDNGVWKKVPLAEYERIMAAKASSTSNSSADDDQAQREVIKEEDEVIPTKEQESPRLPVSQVEVAKTIEDEPTQHEKYHREERTTDENVMPLNKTMPTQVTKIPPKTLPKPKYRRKSKDNAPPTDSTSVGTPEGTKTIDDSICSSQILSTSFDADKTLIEEEEILNTSIEKNGDLEKCDIDSSSNAGDKKPDVQIFGDILEENVDKENLSSICVSSTKTSTVAENACPEVILSNERRDASNLITDIRDGSNDNENRSNLQQSNSFADKSCDMNLAPSHAPECKEKTSPQDDLSFAEKLKKAERRFGKYSQAVLESKDVFKPRKRERVTLQPLKKKNNGVKAKENEIKSEIISEPTSNDDNVVAQSTVTHSPQKLRAVRIKQEIFPEEEPITIHTPKLTAIKICQETFPKEEPTPEILETDISGKVNLHDFQQQQPEVTNQGSLRRDKLKRKGAGVKFYVGGDDIKSCDDKNSGECDISVVSVTETQGGGDSVVQRLFGTNQLPKHYINPSKYNYSDKVRETESVNMRDLSYQRLDLPVQSDDLDEVQVCSAGQFTQTGLLSEIVELEESNGEDSRTAIAFNDQNHDNSRRVWHKSSSAADRFPNKSPVPSLKTYNRSHSLPSGTLSYPGSRIVYRDGHFVIETGYCDQSSQDDESEELCPGETTLESPTDSSCNQDCNQASDKERTISDQNRTKLKRISYSEPHLCDSGDDYDEEENVEDYDADVFLQNDGDVTVIDTDESCDYTSQKPSVPRRSKPDRECPIPRPLSVDENQLLALKYESEPHDSTMKQIKKSLRDAKARRSKSFKEMSDRIDDTSKLKRNSSFREAQEKGAVNMSPYTSGSGLSRSDSTGSSREELRPKSPGFLQRFLFKRKSFSEKHAKPGDTASRESFMKKMSLKGLFANKKDKTDSSPSKSNSNEPPSPPIAAFQGDLDIHAVDSAPTSPFTNSKFRRRHTSADIYGQNPKNSLSNSSLNSVRRTSDCQQNRPGIKEDQSSIKSYTLNLDHPKRPISPKPSTVSITRRNSNLSLPSSPLKESPFELTMDNSPNRRDTDSISTCSINSSNLDSSSLVSATNQSICDSSDGQKSLSKQSSASSSIVSPTSQDLEKLSNLVQGGEMTSSNSNDSGIQHDVSVHSSSESLKTSSHDSSSSVVRRRKSPSPRPERPKSEISVRWADLVETTEITPVKRRENSQRNKPRPKSDIEENLEMFDELYGEVIGDFDSLTGGSSFKSDMKPFGSEMSLQPYCSLQSLDSLRMKQEAQDQKPNKRRMSTPQPIKTRLDRTPRKQRQRKSSQLVRSHSMPESLDKLHRRKRLHSMLGSSNLHCDDFLNHLDEDTSSDDGSEFSVERISLHEKCMSTRTSQAQLSTLDEMPEGENLNYAEALWDHITMDPEELGFHAGDVIEVMDMADKDWWWGAIDDREGWFPATFVRLRVNQERFEEDIVSQSETTQNLSPNLRRVSVINKEQARENVVNEIISAEREYVKHLKDVVEGYIKHARKRHDMFSEDRICVIFGNIEEIYNFSNRFLQSLDHAFNTDSPHLSQLGHCFLTHSKEFEIYSDYCNNHPSASEELKDLYRKQKYRHFFEACRLLQEMIEIPLEGFLLTPVQKICKYPLQLAELLKYTPSSHPDFTNVQAALDAMKKIAALINERKRKMESIEKLARWQQTVEDWQGPDLLELSSELIMSGEFNKVNSAGWSQERYFFLFDHQLIYCKKDLLKKNGFSYKGRVDLDECRVISVEDGKDLQYNVTVKNAWKLHETVRDKWYLLYTKTQNEKQRWLRAFQTERQRVKEDQENNFVPVHWKKTVLNKLRASKEKQQSRNMPIQYQKEFLRGIPSHATLPRSYAKKHKEKKKAWSLFSNKKTK